MFAVQLSQMWHTKENVATSALNHPGLIHALR